MLADVMFIKCPLQEERIQALERFWKEVVENHELVHGGVKARASLVLPKIRMSMRQAISFGKYEIKHLQPYRPLHPCPLRFLVSSF